MKITSGACVLLLSCGLVGGCAAPREASPVEARFNPVSGALLTTVDAPLERAWTAAQGAVEELQFRAGPKTRDGLTAVMTAKTATDDEVRIRLDKRTESTTRVRIGVGPFGRQATARAVLDRMLQKL